MFDFEFGDYDDPTSGDALRQLIEAYEEGRRTGNVGFYDSETLEDIATFYFEEGRLEEALEVIDRLLDAQPYSSDAWLRRGVLLNHLERHTEALDAYDRALALNPADAETLINRGITLDTLDRLDEALGAYYAVLDLDPLN
ncbi:MAG: tetratricopeptide repeat protein, partial [Bacteroidota bacterium]